ncbi:hypothetical protein CTAYLR_003473 [Chrysophaeum taylorii]|uniref:Activator of Hsp90 ATPase AHSA1-like N-terminal domain-containing protein n=1 Tax=Chrysophaeum taylorii TaxID=2483200 RepID=A0AAD7U9Z8_9STRA|nr:hypothetical protein CTAYLR_003473 [Chrysophaeum taylorii]
MDADGGLLKFFRGSEEEVLSRCAQHPAIREHLADAAFVAKVRSMSERARAATEPAKFAELGRELMQDPRLTQCAMLGAGVNLTVDEADMRKAERTGDIEKRSPLRVDDLVEAERCENPAEARAKGTSAYAKSPAKALAFWVRALRFRRDEGIPDEPREAAALYSNIAQALLKLGHPGRAEQAASRALKYYDAPHDVFALYRRALAREALRKYELALEDAKQVDETLAARLEKLVDVDAKQRVEKVKRKQEENKVGKTRASGLELSRSKANGSSELGYLEERDYSHDIRKRLNSRVLDIQVDLGNSAYVQITELRDQTTASVAVTLKRGARALYYDLDVHCSWVAHPEPTFDLDEDDEARPIKGTIRLYNVSHETDYDPGADPNVAFMYQLGYQGFPPPWFDGKYATDQAPVWAKRLIDGAHSLYEALALDVKAMLDDFKQAK